jgi:hypothetical protein
MGKFLSHTERDPDSSAKPGTVTRSRTHIRLEQEPQCDLHHAEILRRIHETKATLPELGGKPETWGRKPWDGNRRDVFA